MAKYRVDIPAGPIWNQQDAEVKAPRIAAAHLGKWTGQWTTVVPNEMSVVGVEFDVPLPNTGTRSVNVLTELDKQLPLKRKVPLLVDVR